VNRHIQRLGIALVVCYLAVFVKLHQTQMLQVDEFSSKPDNHRPEAIKYNKPRGKIVSADGALLAQSIDVGGNLNPRRREYPEGDLFGQVTGYYSGVYGSEGVEKRYDEQLRGDTVRQQFDGLANLFAARENVGNVTLTVRKDLQQLARDQIGDRDGAAVVMDPRDGSILALWSNPSYNPQLLDAVGKDEDIAASAAAWNAANADPSKPMLSKAFREVHNPGSTFKVVTAAVGLQTGKVADNRPVYPVEDSYTAPDNRLQPHFNYGHERCGGALPQILTQSCNSAFMRMGADVGGPALVQGARGFGYNQTVPIDLPNPAKSTVPETLSGSANPAQTAIGQQDNFATPLEMAMIAGAFAKDGVIMKPHVMKDVRNSDATVVETFKAEPWLTATDPGTAADVRNLMLGPVNDPNGTAKGRVNPPPGMTVGGKTGTAETGEGANLRLNTWFIGYAGPTGQTPSVVVAVCLFKQPNNGPITGGQVAGPVADALIHKALEIQAQPETDVSTVIRPTTTTTTPLPGTPAPAGSPVTPGIITGPVGARRD
jgi:peptidoglycan glycosyltransferase